MNGVRWHRTHLNSLLTIFRQYARQGEAVPALGADRLDYGSVQPRVLTQQLEGFDDARRVDGIDVRVQDGAFPDGVVQDHCRSGPAEPDSPVQVAAVVLLVGVNEDE